MVSLDALPQPLVIVGVSAAVITLIELFGVWMNSNGNFRRLVGDIDRMQAELDKLTGAGVGNKKREKTLETQMTLATRDFMMLRWRQFMVMSLALAGTFWWLRTTYKDQVIAELPFTPMFPFSKVARNFMNPDAPPTACGWMFLYVLTNLALRPTLSRALGTSLPANVSKATEMSTMMARFGRIAGLSK